MKINALITISIIFFIGLTLFLILKSDMSKKTQDKIPQTEANSITSEIKDSVGTTDDSDAFEIPQVQGVYSAPPQMTLNQDSTYTAKIITNKGQITVNLFADMTPITVNNFVFLANEGFYDQTKSHRVLNGFMVQFGDPLTKDDTNKDLWGRGDPGYKFADEPFEGEYIRGIVAMANSGPNTNGSQFFIMHQDTVLPPNYVIFGKVADDASLAVLDTIAETEVGPNMFGEVSVPQEDIVIEEINILENQ